MKKKKYLTSRIILFLLGILIIIFGMFYLYGCSAPPSTSDNTVQIEFWHAMGGPLGKVLDAMIDDFNKEYEGRIYLKSVKMGNYTALVQKIMAAVSVQPPALAQAYEAWTSQFVAAKVITPMNKFIDDPEIGFNKEEFEDIIPVFREGNSWEGIMWSFPFNKSVRAMYYNKKVFARSGIDSTLTPPHTWDDFVKVSQQITQDIDGDGEIDQWGTAFPVRNLGQFANLMISNGGSFLNEDETMAVFNSPEAVDALQCLVDLIYKYKVMDNPKAGYQYQNDFLAGNIGMIAGSTVSYVYMNLSLDTTKVDIGFAPVPYIKEPAMNVQGTNCVIFNKVSEEKQLAAWEFVKWFTNTENTARWSLGTYYAPVRYSALELPEMQERFEKQPGYKDVLAQLNYATYEPRFDVWLRGRRTLEQGGVEPALRGRMTPAEALNSIADQLNYDLERKRKRKKD